MLVVPNREIVAGFDDATTYRPGAMLYAQRAVVDACRVLIPGYIGLTAAVGGAITLGLTYRAAGSAVMTVAAPFVLLGAAFAALLLVVLLKWGVMGRFRPVVVPLWSPYVWLNEMINGAYESVMAPVVAGFLGTPFAAPLLRLLGCRIGRHCYIGTTLFSEFDLVEIGDHVALNAGAIVQTHLFEDRIMKSSFVKVGEGCSIGNMSVVLYDGAMEPDSALGPMSLLMKGEVVPKGSRWQGIPTVAE